MRVSDGEKTIWPGLHRARVRLPPCACCASSLPPMSSLLDLRDVASRICSKPQRNRRSLARHHRGCEGMWLRHFRHKKRTKLWQAFRARYYEYRLEDCVLICIHHHREIHELYLPWIIAAARSQGPCRGRGWTEAEELMRDLRVLCDRWAKVVSQ